MEFPAENTADFLWRITVCHGGLNLRCRRLLSLSRVQYFQKTCSRHASPAQDVRHLRLRLLHPARAAAEGNFFFVHFHPLSRIPHRFGRKTLPSLKKIKESIPLNSEPFLACRSSTSGGGTSSPTLHCNGEKRKNIFRRRNNKLQSVRTAPARQCCSDRQRPQPNSEIFVRPTPPLRCFLLKALPPEKIQPGQAEQGASGNRHVSRQESPMLRMSREDPRFFSTNFLPRLCRRGIFLFSRFPCRGAPRSVPKNFFPSGPPLRKFSLLLSSSASAIRRN